jgi:hypothetical protein
VGRKTLTQPGSIDRGQASEARTRDQRISNPSILTVPVTAGSSLCGNRIEYLDL